MPRKRNLHPGLIPLGVLVAALAIVKVLSWGISAGLAAVDLSPDAELKVAALMTLLLQVPQVAAVVWAVRRWRISHRDLGLGRPVSWLQSAGIAIASYFVYLIAAGIYLVAIKIDMKNRPEHAVIQVFRENKSAWVVVPLIVAAVIAAPIAEELLFRGYLMRQLQRSMSGPIAIAVSSLLFGIVHLGVIPLNLVPPYVGLGAVLGVVAYSAQSIRPAMVLHAAQNGLSTGIALGSFNYSVLLIVSAIGIQVIGFELFQWRNPGLAAADS